MAGPRFFSESQIEEAKIIGIKTNAESQIIAGGAGQLVVVWDDNMGDPADVQSDPSSTYSVVQWGLTMRDPILIRIQNLHATVPLLVAEDLRDINGQPLCSAVAFTAVLAPGTATDDGRGAAAEWQKNRPNCISIFAASAWRAVIVIRYAK